MPLLSLNRLNFGNNPENSFTFDLTNAGRAWAVTKSAVHWQKGLGTAAEIQCSN